MLKSNFGDGDLVTGKGASTDIIEASAKAYLNAVNRHLNNGRGKKKPRKDQRSAVGIEALQVPFLDEVSVNFVEEA